jgi:hypothetical protein
LERRLREVGFAFHRLKTITDCDGHQSTGQIIANLLKPMLPAGNCRLICGNGKFTLAADHCFNAFTTIPLVRNKDVWKLMVNFRAVRTLKPADYQHYFLTNTVYVLAFPAANDFQAATTAGAGVLLSAPNKKHPS